MLHNEQFKGQKARIKKMRRDIQKHKRGKGGNGKPYTGIQPSTATEVEALPLDDSNVGNKMLRSMGWSQGTGLGLLAQGQVEPVPVVKRLKRRGLGA